MASDSTLDRAIFDELARTKDGGWALGGSLERFSQMKTAAYADSPEGRRAALAEGTRRSRVAEASRPSSGVIDAASTYDRLGSASYRLDAEKNRTVVGNGSLSVEVSGSDPHPAEEVNHARTMKMTGLKSSDHGLSQSQYVTGQPNELLSAMGSIAPWAFSDGGGNHRMYGADDIRTFWSELTGKWQSSGKSTDSFVRTLDIPENGRDAVKAYLDNAPGARKALEDENMWNLVASYKDARPLAALAAAKGGEDRFANGRNFLAADKVPDTIFGIPVASKKEQYTEDDLEFFREHPEAGGYYTMGGDDEEAPQEEDVVQEAPVESRGAVYAGTPEILDTMSFTRDLEENDRTPFELTKKDGTKAYRIGHGFVGTYWADDGKGGRIPVAVTPKTKELTPSQLSFALREALVDSDRAAAKRFPGYAEMTPQMRTVLRDIGFHAGNSFTATEFIKELSSAADNDARLRVFDKQVRTYRKDSGKVNLKRMNARLRLLGLREEAA